MQFLYDNRASMGGAWVFGLGGKPLYLPACFFPEHKKTAAGKLAVYKALSAEQPGIYLVLYNQDIGQP
jgi:hypothetical protein